MSWLNVSEVIVINFNMCTAHGQAEIDDYLIVCHDKYVVYSVRCELEWASYSCMGTAQY